jgi:hypothetical protein
VESLILASLVISVASLLLATFALYVAWRADR